MSSQVSLQDTHTPLLLRRGDESAAVLDIQQRLTSAGYDTGTERGTFGEATETAVRAFQTERGIAIDGICGPDTWEELTRAGYQLGDRNLYMRSPMMTGDDVLTLQEHLGKLGFNPIYHDGIFGERTHKALQDFQRDSGIDADGVAGYATVEALVNLSRDLDTDSRSVAEMLEAEKLRNQPPEVRGRKIVVGITGASQVISQALARHLREAGAEVLQHATIDAGQQAHLSNEWDSDAYIGIAIVSEDFSISYYKTAGFESVGGKALADHCVTALKDLTDQGQLSSCPEPKGMRLSILRSTRMPAVWCRLGPPEEVVTRSSEIAEALSVGVVTWCANPVPT